MGRIPERLVQAMQCASCQHENEVDSRFCAQCGGRLERACHACGGAIAEGSRFCRHCGAGQEEAAAPVEVAPAAPAAAAGGHGERRQLTVMFCDLVGSTQLSQSVDPEELREVVTSYQDACAQAVKRFEGYIAQYLGDGLLIYFGYPQAHEDDAERAVRAGLAIQVALAELNARRATVGGAEISARLGIHTGPVVVGEIGDDARHQPMALGDTLNVASRLESVAEPGGVLISQTTLRLVSGLFVTHDLGTPVLKGVSEPIRVHAVERGAGVGGRIWATDSSTPLVGRDREIAQFLDCWEQVQEGHGQVLPVSGDAGIGKSRLLVEFREQLAETANTWLEVRCSPYISGSAFQPVVELYETGLGFTENDSPADKLKKLEEGLEAMPGLRAEDCVPYLARLLGLPPSQRYPVPDMSPGVQRERTLDAVLAPLLAMEAHQPILLIYEDLQWADPSSLELVGRLIDQAPTMRIMLVLTFRPGFDPPFSLTRSYVSPMALTRLSKRYTREVVESASGGGRLPPRLLDEIVARADGVPLFAEELARSVLESGLIVEQEGRFEFRGRVSDLTIPTTLQDSLMARLDRLSAAKQVAQLGATLGREFSYGLVEAAADIDVPMLRNGLEQLVGAEILYQRGTPPESTYTFKHALLQDTAYESQLKSRRLALHARIAAILEERFPHRVAAEPEVMARHCAAGGLASEAITYCELAGKQAMQRLANPEAVEYFGQALEQLATLAACDERHQREIGLRMLQIGPLSSLRGYDDLEVVACRSRVEALCDELGSGPQQLPALVGLSVYNMTRGDLPRANTYAQALLDLVDPLDIAPLQVAGHAILGSSAITSKTIPEATGHLSKAVEIASANELPPPQEAFDIEALAIARSTYGIALVLDGRPDQALAETQASVERAGRIGHLHTLGSCLYSAAVTSYFLDDPIEAKRWADETLERIEGRGFHTPESGAHVFRGWARVLQGDATGATELEEGLEQAAASGTLGGLVQLYLTAADTHQMVGDFVRAEEMLKEALRVIARTGEVSAFAPQVPMFRASFILESGEGELEEAERLLIESIESGDCWHAFKSPWMELRSANLLGRLALRTGNREDARRRLALLYEQFSEGFDARRLQEAKGLLRELG